MNFIKHDLGYKSGGDVAVVTLTTAANVQLMDSVNFQNYHNGRRYSYYGGYRDRSPVYLRIPHSGHWHIVIDLGGYSGRVGSSVQVLSNP